MKLIFKCMFDSFDYHIFVWQLMDRGVIGVSGARALWLAGEEGGLDLAPVTTPPPLMEDWIVRGICRTSAIVTLTPVLRWPQGSTNRYVALRMMCPRGEGGAYFIDYPPGPPFHLPNPYLKIYCAWLLQRCSSMFCRFQKNPFSRNSRQYRAQITIFMLIIYLFWSRRLKTYSIPERSIWNTF